MSTKHLCVNSSSNVICTEFQLRKNLTWEIALKLSVSLHQFTIRRIVLMVLENIKKGSPMVEVSLFNKRV